jgi:hypothetical protein
MTSPRDDAAPRRFRRPGLMLTGAVLIASSGLGTACLVSSVQDRTAVLVAARSLQAGSTVGQADLAEVQVAIPTGVAALPADQRDALVGKVARLDLAAGSLLAPGSIGDPVAATTGQSVVVLALPASRMPASGLRPGQQLLLVSTTDAGPTSNTATEQEPGAPSGLATADAVVIRVGTAEPGGTTPVDVAVNVGDGPLWAGLAASGRVTVLVTPRRGAQQ